MFQVHDPGGDLEAGRDRGQSACRGIGLRRDPGGVLRVEEELAREVRVFDNVPVDDRHPPDSGAGRDLGSRRAHSADSHEGDRIGTDAPLARLPDAGKQDGAGIAVGRLH